MKLLNLMVDSGTKLVMGVSAIAVLVVTFAQVLFRYVLKSPLPWSQDVLRLAFTYLVFWGAAWCVREKGHLNVDVVLTAIPVRLRAAVELVMALEEASGITIDDADVETLKTVGDIVKYLEAHKA